MIMHPAHGQHNVAAICGSRRSYSTRGISDSVSVMESERRVVSPMRFPFSLGRLNSRAGRVGVPRLQAACSSPTSATQTRAVWSAQLLPLRRIRFSNSRAPGRHDHAHDETMELPAATEQPLSELELSAATPPGDNPADLYPVPKLSAASSAVPPTLSVLLLT